MRLGLYKDAMQMPWWATQEKTKLQGPEQQEEASEAKEAAEAKEVIGAAQAVAKKDPEAKEEESKGQVSQEPQTVSEVRRKCKNSILCACHVLSMDGLQDK
eukprot:7470656-Lingulodinium_polyedra.AAC.1